MKETINIILDKNILNKEYIINNNVLLTSTIILIVIPQSNEYLKYNLNLIETKDPTYKYEKEITKHCFTNFEKENEKSYYFTHNKKKYFINDPGSICINNFVLNIEQEMNLEEFEEKTFDGIVNFFKEIIDYDKMKLLLSKIFTSKAFKEAFDFLYPKHFKFPFKDHKEALNFLEKYLNFIPLKTSNTAAITEKFSLEIYYILKKRKISISQNLSNEMKKILVKILYRGSLVKTSCHEMNHDFYNMLVMHSNGKIPLETPRKKYIIEREGGRNMELILFNRKIYKLSLRECLYLLNIKNYDKSLQDFRNGFNELNREDLEFSDNSLFKEFNEIFLIENFSEMSKNNNIACEENEESNFLENTYIDDIEDVNDILGFIRDLSKF